MSLFRYTRISHTEEMPKMGPDWNEKINCAWSNYGAYLSTEAKPEANRLTFM